MGKTRYHNRSSYQNLLLRLKNLEAEQAANPNLSLTELDLAMLGPLTDSELMTLPIIGISLKSIIIVNSNKKKTCNVYNNLLTRLHCLPSETAAEQFVSTLTDLDLAVLEQLTADELAELPISTQKYIAMYKSNKKKTCNIYGSINLIRGAMSPVTHVDWGLGECMTDDLQFTTIEQLFNSMISTEKYYNY